MQWTCNAKWHRRRTLYLELFVDLTGGNEIKTHSFDLRSLASIKRYTNRSSRRLNVSVKNSSFRADYHCYPVYSKVSIALSPLSRWNLFYPKDCRPNSALETTLRAVRAESWHCQRWPSPRGDLAAFSWCVLLFIISSPHQPLTHPLYYSRASIDRTSNLRRTIGQHIQSK